MYLDECRVCSKKCSYLEINRSLKQEIQMFFRNPRDLLQQYWQNVKSVLEFQNFHRTRLQKHQSEKVIYFFFFKFIKNFLKRYIKMSNVVVDNDSLVTSYI